MFDAALQAQLADFLELGVTWDVGDAQQVDPVLEVRE